MKNLYPQLDLGKWLECFYTNEVLDLQGSKILYWVSPFKPILYSPKNKISIIAENFDLDILPKHHFCAVLPSNKIVPFQSQTLLDSGQTFMVAENFDEKEFFITDENFVIVAYGKVPETEFHIYKDYIFEAQNLNGLKKCFLKVRYFATIPFLKYLKCISPFLALWHNFFFRANNWMISNANKCENYLSNTCFCLCFSWVFMIFISISYMSPLFIIVWAMSATTYHTVMLPFHILALPATLCLFKLNFLSFCGFRIALFFRYSYFLPNFMDNLLFEFSMSLWDNHEKSTLPLTTSFEIQPKNKMMFLPFLIPKKRTCFFYVVVLIYEVLFSLMLKVFIETYVLKNTIYYTGVTLLSEDL